LHGLAEHVARAVVGVEAGAVAGRADLRVPLGEQEAAVVVVEEPLLDAAAGTAATADVDQAVGFVVGVGGSGDRASSA
jgi:hypothetical protein